MRYKKYIYLSFAFLAMMLNIKLINAQVCQYASSDNKVLIKYSTEKKQFTIEKRDMNTNLGTEPLINRKKDFNDKTTGLTIPAVDPSTCPAYIVYRHNSNFIGSDGIFGFSNMQTAMEFSNATNQGNNTKIKSWPLSTISVSAEEFDQMKADISSYGMDPTCEGLFGSKDDPNSLRNLIDEILVYPRFIIPAIILGFGTWDIATAVLAQKEENMKKAQARFIRRVLIGVCVFLVPTIMDVIMYLADLVWNGAFTTCGI